MHSRIFSLLFLCLLAGRIEAEEQGVHLFILSGQSNMAGLDPNVSFTPTVEQAFGKEHVIVVKDAQGGQPIRRWYKQWKPKNGPMPEKNGDLYDRLMEKVNKAIEGKTVATVTFVWMQGENDAKTSHGEVYADALRGLIDQLASDLDRKDVNFVIGRISDFSNDNKSFPHWTIVRDAQVKVAEENERGAWVDTDDLNDKPGKDGTKRNDLHYTKDGYAEFGKRCAEKAIELIRKKH